MPVECSAGCGFRSDGLAARSNRQILILALTCAYARYPAFDSAGSSRSSPRIARRGVCGHIHDLKTGTLHKPLIPPRSENARISRPSFDHVYPLIFAPSKVRRRGSPPLSGMTYKSVTDAAPV